MELLEEAERAARLLLANEQVSGETAIVAVRTTFEIRLELVRRHGRAIARALIVGGKRARIRLGWNYSESELLAALVEVYVRVARTDFRLRLEEAQIRCDSERAAKRAAEQAAAAERAREEALEYALRARVAKRTAELDRLREERAKASAGLFGRVLGLLGRR